MFTRVSRRVDLSEGVLKAPEGTQAGAFNRSQIDPLCKIATVGGWPVAADSIGLEPPLGVAGRFLRITRDFAQSCLRASAKITPYFLTASRVYSKVSMD